MAIHEISPETGNEVVRARPPGETSLAQMLQLLLAPLASLKLTVVLMAMAIFIILAGTLAQVDKENWQVVDEYFRTAFAWIDFQIFLPPTFFPNRPQLPGGFYFPGGWLIGTAMAINLLAAHGLRFKIQASGGRLRAGLGVLVIGALVTWLVVASGSNKGSSSESTLVSYDVLWNLSKVALVVASVAAIFGLVQVDRRRKIDFWVLLVASLVLGSVSIYVWVAGDDARLDDSGMRILWQLGKASFASLVLLVGCVLLFKKRAGIVLLHGGVGLMMLGELLTGTYAVESQMVLNEKASTDYAQDMRSAELVFVDATAADHDAVIAVPQSLLVAGESLSDARLPVDIELVRYFKNAALRKQRAGEETPATTGLGLRYSVEELPPATGTDTDTPVDLPAAYVQLKPRGGGEPAVHLLSIEQAFGDAPEHVEVGGKTYDVYLRFKRIYKPYSVSLIDVRKEDYLGTDTPRNYSSDIRLIDPTEHMDFNKRIWMNNPLRYADDTLYQTGYRKNPKTGEETSTIAVVSNPSWMIPYVACMIVVVGMLAHFSGTLGRFLRRQSEIESPAASPSSAAADPLRRAAKKRVDELVPVHRRGLLDWVIPLVMAAIVFGYLGSKAVVRPTPTDELDLYEFGRLPVVNDGRVKPFDTLARNTLAVLTNGRSEFTDEKGTKQPAIHWLLDVIVGADGDHRVFRIDNPDVVDALSLPTRSPPVYSVKDLRSKLEEYDKQVSEARKHKPKQMNAFQRKVMALAEQVRTYMLVRESFRDVLELSDVLEAEAKRDPQGTAQKVIRLLLAMSEPDREMPLTRAVPDPSAEGGWLPYVNATAQAHLKAVGRRQQEMNPATSSLMDLFAAYGDGNISQFNRDLDVYRAAIEKAPPEDYTPEKTDFEAWFNHSYVFYYAMVMYLFAFVLVALSWLGLGKYLRKAAFWLIVCIFIVHAAALVGRIYISGRPPVTNLYSSAVFIGFGCVLLGLVMELIFGMGIGSAVAAVIGMATLYIAQFLGGQGDTFTVLQAVLDTNFWLATHVVCITLGYATTYVAGFLAVAYLVVAMANAVRERRGQAPVSATVGKDLIRMIYGTLCFAILFSFFGTVLGGLWGDDSWGRFWGWDPKENGALIIVLWNALVLHARWGGMVKDRGLAMLAMFGNITVSWSYFGTNQLGVGLHTYGFNETVQSCLWAVLIGQLTMLAIAAALPKRVWAGSAAA